MKACFIQSIIFLHTHIHTRHFTFAFYIHEQSDKMKTKKKKKKNSSECVDLICICLSLTLHSFISRTIFEIKIFVFLSSMVIICLSNDCWFKPIKWYICVAYKLSKSEFWIIFFFKRRIWKGISIRNVEFEWIPLETILTSLRIHLEFSIDGRWSNHNSIVNMANVHECNLVLE